MHPQGLYVYGGSALFGVLMALALSRPFPAAAVPETRETPKQLLLAEGGLEELHHRIYKQVGPEVWEYTVKPDFLHAVTLETIRSTGTLWPEEGDVLRWVRTHPAEARRLMQELGARFALVAGD